jgi:hypothetical protein
LHSSDDESKVGEPLPEDIENEWMDNVCNMILVSTNDSNDEMFKPKIANIILEDTSQA